MGLSAWTSDPRAPQWGEPALPAWAATFRPFQLLAVQQILDAFAAGNEIVVLEAPTGSGKTLVASLVRRLLNVRAIYTCVDRGLQDQFLESFDYAKVLKGRRNYPTQLFPEAFAEIDQDKHLSVDDCTVEDNYRKDQAARKEALKLGEDPGEPVKRCDWCHPIEACPYRVAKRQFLAAKLACTNVAYFLAEANGPGLLSKQACIILDEVDRLEGILMGAVNVRFSKYFCDTLNFPRWPLAEDLQSLAGATAWADWLAKIDERLMRVMREMRARRLDRQERRQLRHYERVQERIAPVNEGLMVGRWVLHREAGSFVEFKAVKVDWAAPNFLWRHGQRWLLMSATVLNAAAMLRDLGITEKFAVVRMPSTFPVANRPIYYTPVANVVQREEAAAIPKLATAIQRIMAAHPEDRILVHVVSNRLMKGLQQHFLNNLRTFWYAGADLRADTLEQYEKAPAAVLFAPALERGLDLPDELCRVVIVAKLPYPYLGDPQVDARMKQDREWYSLQTLRALVQMTGRGMRHADDFCTTYILDAQYEVLYRRDGRLLPKWWTEAVQWGVLT